MSDLIAKSNSTPTLARSGLTGAVGFGLVSLFIFATVAFGERWMYRTLGLYGAYLVWTVMFILLGGGVFGSLSVGRWRLPKFYLLFGVAFFAYAAAWTSAYFILRRTAGEWVGSVAGSLLMALVFAAAFGAFRSIIKLWMLLLVTNSIGYFLGSAIWQGVGGRVGMLLWGVVYGLFLGAGIGTVLRIVQTPRPE